MDYSVCLIGHPSNCDYDCVYSIKARNNKAILPPEFFVMILFFVMFFLALLFIPMFPYGCGDQSELVTEMKSLKDQVG